MRVWWGGSAGAVSGEQYAVRLPLVWLGLMGAFGGCFLLSPVRADRRNGDQAQKSGLVPKHVKVTGWCWWFMRRLY